MRQCASTETTNARRAIVVIPFVGAFLFALILAAAPGWHEQLHADAVASHQCAVTLLTFGTCDTIYCAPLCAAPAVVASCDPIAMLTAQAPVAPHDFSLLEHAPPA